MLVMDITWRQAVPLFSRIGSDKPIFKLETDTAWEFYFDATPNIVLRAIRPKRGAEEDALFVATLPTERIVPVLSVSWGKYPVITTTLEESFSGEQAPALCCPEMVPEAEIEIEEEEEAPEE